MTRGGGGNKCVQFKKEGLAKKKGYLTGELPRKKGQMTQMRASNPDW